MTIPASNTWTWEPSSNTLHLRFPRDSPVENIIERSHKSRGGYLSFDINLPRKPRSTGENSQNHHLWGHAEQIGEHLGYDRREMLYLIAEMTPGWPMAEFRGHLIPRSEALIDSDTAAKAIETAHRIAAENGIRLMEGNDGSL